MSHDALAHLLAVAIILALNAYVLLGGADFGGGVWDLFARGPRRDRQRDLIIHAMGPVWEANHVWLIVVVVLLFTCFPGVFARLAIAMHIPLSLVLVGIVLRGSAFTFRSYGSESSAAERRWGRVFAVASLVTPLLLGVAVGTIAAGRVRSPAGQSFLADYVTPWFTPFAWGVGLFTLVLFAFLAAVYLTLEARGEPALQEDFRRRALAAGIAAFGVAVLTIVLAWRDAPLMWRGLMARPQAVLVHALTAIAAVTALAALHRRRYGLARLAAAAQVTAILWGWALAQYPYLLPPDLTVTGAAAPALTLGLTAAALAAGGLVLVPSLRYLFRVFKGAGTGVR
ncbi:MAG TPA: cytochrome d ubiquinol oxidase subunit II [Gemmatimonadales bacterium]|nr:cytochrome d ubiquinol oxidase subunit II [Gemmatimonadales bacterium]